MQPTDTRALNVLPLLLKTESDNHVKHFYSTHTISLSLATGLLILHSLQQRAIIIDYPCALCSLSTITVTAQRYLCKLNPRKFSHQPYFHIIQKVKSKKKQQNFLPNVFNSWYYFPPLLFQLNDLSIFSAASNLFCAELQLNCSTSLTVIPCACAQDPLLAELPCSMHWSSPHSSPGLAGQRGNTSF